MALSSSWTQLKCELQFTLFVHHIHLFQKSLRYNHHKENYKISLEEGVTPTGLKLRKAPAFLPVTDCFQQKWDAILFNAERNLVELPLVETGSVIKKLEIDFNKELKRQFPDSIVENRSVIKKKHQPYKKQLSIRRRKKWARFKDRHKYSKPVRVAELNIARNKNLESSKSKHFVLQVGNEAINANGTKGEESHCSY